MALLASATYDPSIAVTKSTTALLAMTALDTSNLRLTFTVPASGSVMVRLYCNFHGSTTLPVLLLGVLEGTTLRGRVSATASTKNTLLATAMVSQESVYIVSGLTPGANLTWDAAYGVEIISGAGGIKYGGPNDTTADNAFGAFCFEIWNPVGLLASATYDPGTAVALGSAASALAVFDTTNLRLTFTVPASGKVLVRIRTLVHGGTTGTQPLFGVMQGASVMGRAAGIGAISNAAGVPGSTGPITQEAVFYVSGLTPSANLTWDAAWGIETFATSSQIKYGGPNDTTTNNAFGAICYEIWQYDPLATATYDPGTRVTASTTVTALTAVDTTNLRLAFTVPSNGSVLVRLGATADVSGSTNGSSFLGVLEGATIRGRLSPLVGFKGGAATGAAQMRMESIFAVTGLIPSENLTWDAAFAWETAAIGTEGMYYGGPNDTTASNAQGAFCFDIISATNLLGSKLYDPATAATFGSAASAMAAFDTTNLRITFTVPASGKVQVRIQACVSGAATFSSILLGVLQSATVIGRVSPAGNIHGPSPTTTIIVAQDATFIVTGLTPGANLTWDAAWGIETFVASSLIKYGGPNDTTASNAWGAILFEVWQVD